MRTHGAFILARYSTDRQNPDSIEVQVEKCTDWCNSNGIPILGIFADMAVSGMKDTRPQYNAMMQQLRQRAADCVVIYDQSRMFRKMTAWFAFRDELEAMGVKVVSVTQPMIGKDLRDPTNFLTEGSMALFNQIWALQTRQKVIEKMRFMAKGGQHTGGTPPLGYTVIDGRLAVYEPEAAIVRRIFAEYAAGHSYREIIAGLNADDLTTKNGRPFGSNSLHDLLKNEKYIGTLIYGKVPKGVNGKRNTHAVPDAECIRMENAIPAIVDKDIWEKVQVKMTRNQRDKAGRPNHVRKYPLKGKVFCSECGAAMTHTASTTRSGQYHYYACSGKQRLHNCELMPIRMEVLEQKVAGAIKEVWGESQSIPKLLQILRDESQRACNNAVDKMQALVSRRNEIAYQLDNAATVMLQGLNSPTLMQRVKALEAEKNVIDYDIQQLRATVEASVFPEDEIRDMLSMIAAAGDTTAILNIVCRVEVSHTHITVWTMLDTRDDGTLLDRDLLDKSRFIEIDGAAPPAPRKKSLLSSGQKRLF